MHLSRFAGLCLATLLLCGPALAAEGKTADTKNEVKAETPLPTFTITMKKRTFEPLELIVPADKEFILVVKNQDQQPFEFESAQLHRERIVQPGGSVSINFKPLKPGTYKYADDFNGNAVGFITVQ